MKCALASMGFINEDVHHNNNVIIETMKRYAKDADISRFLDALEKRYKEEHRTLTVLVQIMFFWMGSITIQFIMHDFCTFVLWKREQLVVKEVKI